MTLNVRNKLGFIDGTIPKPPDNHPDAVSKQIGQSLLYKPTASAIWLDLMSRFRQDDAHRVFEIEQRLSTLQHGSMDCECNAALMWEKLQQRSRVTKFLMGLNEAYQPTHRHILMLKPMPSIASGPSDNVGYNSMAPSTNGYFSGPTDNIAYAAFRPHQKPYCTHCNRVGHTIHKCFKLHGYPPGHRNAQRPPMQQVLSQFAPPRASFPTGQRPQFPTHAQFQQTQNQYQQNQYSHQGALSNAVMNYASYTPAPTQTATNLDLSSFTSDQIQSLIHQLSTQTKALEQPSSYPSATITEHGAMAATSSSGATSHVCSDLSLFDETFPVTGVTVSLPNGTRVAIIHIGTDYTRDLIIGKGVLIHCLYILEHHDISTSANSVSASFSGSLQVDGRVWHQRLGHPSSVKLQYMSGTLPMSISSSSHDQCDICPLAKQKKLPFVSHSKLSHLPFDLIHIDT
ncbi:PREDICTED: uncharacterized protein LOC109130513 [Camelina sativa]|uniref:Uncharacterized protein LOC109130513 n=1 Tax=Camelina sativa TaxID=90675 RepID=A0ABM1R9G7_CAMSA|nr:PREDICTED: uncharacterized protein LOC109130513 [Camelina sativa]